MQAKVNSKYKRLNGKCNDVKIIDISGGFVKLKDCDGVHFLTEINFNTKNFKEL